MRLIFILLLFSSACYGQFISTLVVGGEPEGSPAEDTTEYFVKTGGNDGNTGHTDAQAFATIAQAASVMEAGDKMYLNKGDTWRETLTIPVSGTAGDYLYFGSYGSGANPQILGSELALDFTNITGNIWGSSTDLDDPHDIGSYNAEIWIDSSGVIIWANSQKTYAGDGDFSDLTEHHDYAWNADSVFLYCDGDPDTRYTDVEVPQREWCVLLDQKEYIEFDGIDMLYQVRGGVQETYPTTNLTGFIIKNCELAYNSIADAVNGQGHGTHVCYSDMLYENLTVHDCGRRGLSIVNYGASNIDSIIIQDCEFYNGVHTTGPDIESGATGDSDGDISNIIIRRNFFNETEGYSRVAGVESMFFQGPQSGTGEINQLYVYNNIFKYPWSASIQLEQVEESFIYNNTFYGHNSAATSNTFHVRYTDGCENAALKNNLFYSDRATDANDQGIALYEAGNQDYAEIDADYNLSWRTNAGYTIYYVDGTEYDRTQWAAMRAASSWETNGPNPADPTFTDGGNDNFNLQTGSPAISTGLDLSGTFTTDYDGVTRTTWNIGAFETVEDP